VEELLTRKEDLADSGAGSMMATSGPVIEVFADIWCPFSHVGLRMIQTRRARAGRTDLAIWVRAWPLELVNRAPLDATITRDHAEDLREQVAPNLFRHLDIERFPSSTIGALALANRAYRTSPQVGERISFALRNALFEDGRDISDQVTLEHLAHDHGTVMPDESDRADVMADWHEGKRRGVLGSPHFFCGGTDAFCPSLDITKDPVHGVTTVWNAGRLTEFLDGCINGPA
jgi:predicted DsbA family dithiol-disulfide isomerase